MQEVVVGVDSHKSTFAGAIVDLLGKPIEAKEFRNEPKGHEGFLKWARSRGDVMRIGVECSETWGAALTRYLLAAELDVREVPTRLAHREARRRTAQAKSDPGDALAIARVVAREQDLPSPRRSEVSEELKLLSDYRDQLRRARNQFTNRIHKDLAIMKPGYEKNIPDLTGKRILKKVIELIAKEEGIRAELMRDRVAEVQRIDQEILRITKVVEAKVAESETSLTELPGVGALTAARIIGEVGDITKFKSKAAFGHITGTAPIPASSGTVVRYRLNRAGNRRLNHAIHFMAITQLRIHPDAKDYILKKVSEGKSKREAIRCLKRHLANVIYRKMMSDAERLKMAA